MPCLSRAIFSAMISTQVTLLPISEKQVPVTRPTYPVPMTQIVDTLLLLDSHKWIFVFLFSDGAWRSMSRKDHQVIFKRIQLLTDRFLDLLIASTLKVSPSDTTIEEGITGEYTIGATHQADTTASMARSMKHFQR